MSAPAASAEVAVTLTVYRKKRVPCKRLEARGRLEAVLADAANLLEWEGARRITVRLASGRYLAPILKGAPVPHQRPATAATDASPTLFPPSDPPRVARR